MNPLIDKLLAIEFVCVNIDEDAKFLYEQDCMNNNNNIKHYLFREDKSKPPHFFRSFKTMAAWKTYLEAPTLENHHLCFHYLLVDRFIDHLIHPEVIDKWSFQALDNTVKDALQCAPNSEELIKELTNYYKRIAKQ